MDYKQYLIKMALQTPAPEGGAGTATQVPSKPWYENPVTKGDRLRKFLKMRRINRQA